jgi:hypothetical protein
MAATSYGMWQLWFMALFGLCGAVLGGSTHACARDQRVSTESVGRCRPASTAPPNRCQLRSVIYGAGGEVGAGGAADVSSGGGVVGAGDLGMVHSPGRNAFTHYGRRLLFREFKCPK